MSEAPVGRRNAAAMLVSGAALGMLGMVVHLSGHLKGFVAPIVALPCPLVALGAHIVRRHAPQRR